MSYNYMESLSGDALTRYKNKLEVVKLSGCPYKLPADVWLNDMKQWPEVTFHDHYLYLTSLKVCQLMRMLMPVKSLGTYPRPRGFSMKLCTVPSLGLGTQILGLGHTTCVLDSLVKFFSLSEK